MAKKRARAAAKPKAETLEEEMQRRARAEGLFPGKTDRTGGSQYWAYQKFRSRFIADQFQGYFGEDTKLANWQKLCRDLDLGDDHQSITQCRKALQGVWVNIWDFLDAMRFGQPVKKWPSQRKLAEYTIETGRIFPKNKAKANGPLRVLLAQIF